jgi:hypothetical protein
MKQVDRIYHTWKGRIDAAYDPGPGAARTVVVHCHTAVEEAQRRFIARDRARGGGAAHIVAQMERGVFDWVVFDPLDVGAPTLHVDTTPAYAPGLDTIVAFCRGNTVGR